MLYGATMLRVNSNINLSTCKISSFSSLLAVKQREQFSMHINGLDRRVGINACQKSPKHRICSKLFNENNELAPYPPSTGRHSASERDTHVRNLV
jgi:hypothetical protein